MGLHRVVLCQEEMFFYADSVTQEKWTLRKGLSVNRNGLRGSRKELGVSRKDFARLEKNFAWAERTLREVIVEDTEDKFEADTRRSFRKVDLRFG